MKKLILPVLLLFFLASCSDDIQDNSPSLQGNSDYGFFHSLDPVVESNEDGTFSIVGKKGSRVLKLTVSSLSLGAEYELGGDSPNVATFTTADSLVYSTDSLGEGVIKIKEVVGDYVTGTFNFNARVNGVTGDTLNFNEGHFFSVPMAGANGGDDENPEDLSPDCFEAMLGYNEAFSAFVDAGYNEEASEVMQEKCSALSDAIEHVIDECGDDEGVFQSQLDQLDCSAEYWDEWDWDDDDFDW